MVVWPSGEIDKINILHRSIGLETNNSVFTFSEYKESQIEFVYRSIYIREDYFSCFLCIINYEWWEEKNIFFMSRDPTDIFNIKKIYQGKCLEK